MANTDTDHELDIEQIRKIFSDSSVGRYENVSACLALASAHRSPEEQAAANNLFADFLIHASLTPKSSD